MRKTIKMNESSVLYRKIDELALSEIDRVQAIAALQAADRLVDACDWVQEQFGRVAGFLAPRTAIKHRTFKHQ